MKNKFRKFLDKYFRYPFYDFKQGIKNLIKWFPVIWKDRNWDSDYIFSIIKHKLTTQSEYIEKRGIHVDALYDANKMKLCVRLIDKIQSSEYELEYQNYQVSKLDALSKEQQDKLSPTGYLRAMLEIDQEDYDNYFNKHKSSYRNVIKLYKNNDNKEHVALRIGMHQHQRAIDLLFKIMSTHIERWWD